MVLVPPTSWGDCKDLMRDCMWSPYNKNVEYYYYPPFTGEEVVSKMLKTTVNMW